MFLWDDHRGAYHNSPTTQRSQLECGRAHMLPGRTPQQYRFLATAERHREVLRSTRVLQDLLTCNCGTKLADSQDPAQGYKVLTCTCIRGAEIR
ncbi:hypothetical protein BT67DRAFT_439110, partial [Trichocladium antarcticum]